jgi:hypothetical protein
MPRPRRVACLSLSPSSRRSPVRNFEVTGNDKLRAWDASHTNFYHDFAARLLVSEIEVYVVDG